MPLAVILAIATSVAGGWRAARTIVVPPHAQAEYVRLVIPQTVDGGPDGAYADLRIAGGENRETPYALDATPASTASSPVELSDVGFVPGRYSQAIADLGQSGALHSSIELTTPQPTFFERVQVATSDDRRTWTVVKPEALIYRVAQTNDAGQSAVDFGPSRARWLRVRVLDGAHAFPITGASVAAQSAPPRLVPLSASVAMQTTAGHSQAILDFGTPNTNLGAVAFETRTPEFSRRVSFASSDGTKSDGAVAWDGLNGATISRFAAGRPALTADLGIQRVRLLRVTIDNGNDAPLVRLRITPFGYEHHVIFRAEPGVAYRLLWNNADAVAPTYDLAERLTHEPWHVGGVAMLGAAASTAFQAVAATAPGTPWLQQAALPIALVFACLVLGTVALLALRRSQSEA